MDGVQKPRLREMTWAVIARGHGPSARAYNFLSLVLILFSLALLPLEFLPGLRQYSDLLLIFEILITAIFTFDYMLHVWSSPKRTRYIFSFFGIVDLLSILPFYLGFVATPYIRILRLIRLLRLGEIDPAGSAEEERELEESIGLASGEKVEYIVTRHPVYLMLHCIPCVVSASFAIIIFIAFPKSPWAISGALALLLFALILLWRAWMDFSYDVIYVTTDRVIFQNTHLLGRSVNQIPYQAIMNVKPSYPSIISYILRYGSIIIDTPSAETGEIKLHMVRRHEHAAHLIMQRSVEHTRHGGQSFVGR